MIIENGIVRNDFDESVTSDTQHSTFDHSNIEIDTVPDMREKEGQK